MPTLNIYEAKTHLSKLVDQLNDGAEQEIIIARHGRPVARLVKWKPTHPEKRIGVAKGKITIPDDIDANNAEIAALFNE
jgi:prevent-host-death family protein